MRRRRATVATPGEWQCGVRRLAVANGPNIFQMLLVKSFVRSFKVVPMKMIASMFQQAGNMVAVLSIRK